MWEVFEKLGRDVERRWRDHCYRTEDLPAVASQALGDHGLHLQISHEQLVTGALERNVWPAQFSSRFGQPPINVFVGPGFYIEALTWIDATTSIHQHNFSGAFCVLAGSSVHSQYSFRVEHEHGPRFRTGEIRFLRSELLPTGSIRPILSGDRLIHALFHLDRPSITVVIRTYDDATGPQYEYYRPAIALDPFHDPEPAATQVRLLRGLGQLKSPLLPAALEQTLAGSDAPMAFRCLDVAHEHLTDPEQLARVRQAAERRHGELADLLHQGIMEQRRQRNIVLRRNSIQEAEPRFLLALLLNLPDRRSILSALGERYPSEDPVTVLVRMISEAAGKEQIGLTLSPATSTMLEGMLRDRSFEEICRSLSATYPRTEVERQTPALRAVADELRQSVFLAPLFATERRA